MSCFLVCFSWLFLSWFLFCCFSWFFGCNACWFWFFHCFCDFFIVVVLFLFLDFSTALSSYWLIITTTGFFITPTSKRRQIFALLPPGRFSTIQRAFFQLQGPNQSSGLLHLGGSCNLSGTTMWKRMKKVSQLMMIKVMMIRVQHPTQAKVWATRRGKWCRK